MLGSKITKQPVSANRSRRHENYRRKNPNRSRHLVCERRRNDLRQPRLCLWKYLRVTNRANGKSVIVQVNDCGPYGKGRVIDLNKKAFQKIADLGAGVINVKVEEILN